jgi:GT2 family glycosyltransferase/glycosyltransferase involved in cell wall biosynthesis
VLVAHDDTGWYLMAPWGTHLRQRLRLGPLYCAVTAADRLAAWSSKRRQRTARSGWCSGISVVIADRDAPLMLDEALASVSLALATMGEPTQIIVVANGAPREHYDGVLAKHPSVAFVHSAEAYGFSAAIRRGLDAARHDWTLLLNNDMTLESDALRELMALRADDVFAIGAQIFQQSADRRREETGFVDWYVDHSGVRVFHAPPGSSTDPRESLCVSGGAALFRTGPLRRYVRDSVAYDPFYWEDVEWGLRARQDGWRVLFCPTARARHRHRATTTRFYSTAQIDRVVERNRVLFDLRNGVTGYGAHWLLQRVCDQPYASQRELARIATAMQVLRHRWRARRSGASATPPVLAAAGQEACDLTPSFSFSIGAATTRPRLLLVTPFCVFPPRHGGARRIEGLLQRLRQEFDIVLVTDEASLYDARSFGHFDGLHAVVFVQRPEAADRIPGADLDERMQAHCHRALTDAVRLALLRHRPDLVQIEHVELAALSKLRTVGQRWILGLHDAYDPKDFRDPLAALRFHQHVLATYDATTVCSSEDQGMMAHPRTICVPNGTHLTDAEHAPSASTQLLFMGPFRYAQNLGGIRHFLRVAYPAIKAAVPAARLVVLGGDGANQIVAGDSAFAQPDVSVLEHRDDVRQLLGESALTLNPLSGIRGSSVKVIESLAAGRACVSTEDGARGFTGAGLRGLITVPDVHAMIEPIVGLLHDQERRRALEAPDASLLSRFRWRHCAGIQGDLYRNLLAGGDA